jgi:uncharacterized iron-regulated membrane protein
VTRWQRWLRQPKTTGLRRALFQIHLWTGLGLGLYIVVLCLSGSALVFRDQITNTFETPLPAYEPGRKPLSRAQLTAAAQKAYPGFEVTRVGNRFTRNRPVIEIWVDRGSEHRERLFNPYTGADVGQAIPAGVQVVNWMATLHDELLFGDSGKRVNGVGGGLVAVIALTGLVIWWPGVMSWRRALWVKWNTRWPRFNFDLHSALGFWFFAIVLLWGLSGVYLAFPEPVEGFVDAISDPDAILGERPADIVLRWFTRLHFGRWEGLPWLSAVWAVMGLVPVIMFITGTIMWWNRVVKKRNQP